MGPKTIFLIEFILTEIFHCTRATLMAAIPFDVTHVRLQMKFIDARKCTFHLSMSGEPKTRHHHRTPWIRNAKKWRLAMLFHLHEMVYIEFECDGRDAIILSSNIMLGRCIFSALTWWSIFLWEISLISSEYHRFLSNEFSFPFRRVWWVWSNGLTLYLSESYANIDPNDSH